MVGCVVLNWNGWRDTLACLHSLQHQTAQPLHVWVVDNGSTDDSLQRIADWIAQATGGPTNFTLIPNGVNAGFARGSNVGIRAALAAGAEFVWLLNNDTECPPDTLEKLLRTAAADPRNGVVGTVLLYHHDPTQVQAWGGGRMNLWLGVSRHFYAPTPLDSASFLTFASVLIRRAVLEQVGLLYEGAFMYYEDSDFAMRLAKTHWKQAVAADTAVLHKESASTEGSRNPFMEKTIAVAGLKFLRRHSAVPIVSMPAFVAVKLLNRARLGAWPAFRAVLQAIPEYWRQGI